MSFKKYKPKIKDGLPIPKGEGIETQINRDGFDFTPATQKDWEDMWEKSSKVSATRKPLVK